MRLRRAAQLRAHTAERRRTAATVARIAEMVAPLQTRAGRARAVRRTRAVPDRARLEERVHKPAAAEPGTAAGRGAAEAWARGVREALRVRRVEATRAQQAPRARWATAARAALNRTSRSGSPGTRRSPTAGHAPSVGAGNSRRCSTARSR